MLGRGQDPLKTEKNTTCIYKMHTFCIYTQIVKRHLHNNVVDGNVDQFDEETNEAHDSESKRCGHGNLLKFYRNVFHTKYIKNV